MRYTLPRRGVLTRDTGRMVGAVGLMLAVGVLSGTPASAGPRDDRSVGVVVRSMGASDAAAAQAAVRRLGGEVRGSLDLISGFAAQVPVTAVASLRSTPGVLAVTPDAPVRMSADSWIDDGGKTTVASIKKAAGGKKLASLIGTAPVDGTGIGVALVDSGVAPVTGLDQPGKVINGPDLSFESQAPNLRQLDTYGHGTHMAGIIAGSDPTGDGPGFTGVAPDAHLVSLKVAAADGATDVSQVIAAIDWVVTHRDDPGLNIRVLNLSFGTDSAQDARLDPLSFAVETAWRKGIVVVVAVGNDGDEDERVSMPAANPYVIAVGAADPNDTATRADDTAAAFSSRGNRTRHADVLAAGRSVVSLRAPGSYLDSTYPNARITDANGAVRYFRGSGTSQATAVVSGSVALLLQQRPNLTPDQVKALLVQTADPIIGGDPIDSGAGQVDIAQAASIPADEAGEVEQRYRAGTGLGTLEGARGAAHVIDPETGTPLVGEQDIFGAPWEPKRWAHQAHAGKAWKGGTWNGTLWTGDGWLGGRSDGGSWSARTWSGRTWSGRTWSGRTWSGQTWSGRTWSGRTWSGRTWSGTGWSGH
jgi:serine protease AprX